jgi:hypothetical protein
VRASYCMWQHHSSHCEALAAKASRVAGRVCKAFHFHSTQSRVAWLWPACNYYLLPLLMYSTCFLHGQRGESMTSTVERKQRLYTQMITELHGLPYLFPLRELQALTLSNLQTFAYRWFLSSSICLAWSISRPLTMALTL